MACKVRKKIKNCFSRDNEFYVQMFFIIYFIKILQLTYISSRQTCEFHFNSYRTIVGLFSICHCLSGFNEQFPIGNNIFDIFPIPCMGCNNDINLFKYTIIKDEYKDC